MMGERQVRREALFYGFSLEEHVPADRLLRSIDRFVEPTSIRQHLEPSCGAIGRPSVDPGLMVRMLPIGYCCGVRSERRLCEEVHLNPAHRWFRRLGLDGAVPDHSTFSENRHGRFRDSGLLRRLFEATARRRMAEGTVGGRGSAVDASMVRADASRQKGVASPEELDPQGASRAVTEYLAVLDDAAFGAATDVPPKFVSPADPAARWTAAAGGPARYAYCDNHLVDVDHAVIVDVEATTAVRQAEVGAARTMPTRTAERFGLWPGRPIADTGYGSAAMLGRPVHEQGIEPHIPVFGKSRRGDGTFSREDFRYDHEGDVYFCPAGKTLSTRGSVRNDDQVMHRSSTYDCAACSPKQRCCPDKPGRRVPRSIHEGARDMARDVARTDAYAVSKRERKKVEMLFAHLKSILRLDRLRLRGPSGARDEFHLAAAQNLRKLARLIPAPVTAA